MGVKVEADALTNLERVKRRLGIGSSDTSKDTLLIDLINAASAWVRRYVGHPVRMWKFQHSQAYDGFLEGTGRAILHLPYRPVLWLTYLRPDARLTSSAYWEFTGGAETGGLTYGPDKDWYLDQKHGRIVLVNGMTFPEGAPVRVEGYAGFADGTVNAGAGFPHSLSIFAVAQNGGRYHQVYGWDNAGLAVQAKVDDLIDWFYKSAERNEQGILSRSGEGFTVSYQDDVPKELRSFFDWYRGWPV